MARDRLPHNAPCLDYGDTCQPGQICFFPCNVQGCFTHMQCIDAPAEGKPCAALYHCISDLSCYQGTCLRPSGEGGPCPCRPEAVCDKKEMCVAWGPKACQ